MSASALDPPARDPERLRVVATLAALPDGDALSVTRLQDMSRLLPGSLVICLCELGRAGYVRVGKTITATRCATATSSAASVWEPSSAQVPGPSSEEAAAAGADVP